MENSNNTIITFEPSIQVHNYVETTLEELNQEFVEMKNDGSVWFPSDWKITEKMTEHIDLYPDVSSDYEVGNLSCFENDFGLDDLINSIEYDLFTWVEIDNDSGVYLPRYNTNGDDYTNYDKTKMLEIIKMERSINQEGDTNE